MSLECGECEMDLRGGHSGGCSRHPINGKKHPLRKAVAKLRKSIGARDEHHWGCATRHGKKCDCYASGREASHEALDQLIEALDPGDGDS